MNLKKIQDADVEGKKVLLRVDFNAAVENGTIRERFKIEAARETLDYLLAMGARVALCTHFGRPVPAKSLAGKLVSELEEKANAEFSLDPIKDDVEYILGRKIKFMPDCVGESVKNSLNNLKDDEVILLENVRFYGGEEGNAEEFAKALADGFDIFVNDAFSVSHRDQASITGVVKFLPSYAGFRLQKEVSEMEKIKTVMDHPAVAVIGGAKIETKLPIIKFFEEKCDYILVGGMVANEAIDQKMDFSPKVNLPTDFAEKRFDIGPETIAKFKELISYAKTVIWNGPTGKFEEEKFAASSNEILEAMLESPAYLVVGGGETLEVLEKNNSLKEVEKRGFVSTGGGAMLAYLGGEKMPGIEALQE